MARIAGVNIPENKRVEIALTYIYGIGRTTAKKIRENLNISLNRRVNQLSENEIVEIRKMIDDEFTVEVDLKKIVMSNIKSKMDLGSYQGIRHRKKLPVRGQRTHTNARTRKGKPVAIANKKK